MSAQSHTGKPSYLVSADDMRTLLVREIEVQLDGGFRQYRNGELTLEALSWYIVKIAEKRLTPAIPAKATGASAA